MVRRLFTNDTHNKLFPNFKRLKLTWTDYSNQRKKRHRLKTSSCWLSCSWRPCSLPNASNMESPPGKISTCWLNEVSSASSLCVLWTVLLPIPLNFVMERVRGAVSCCFKLVLRVGVLCLEEEDVWLWCDKSINRPFWGREDGPADLLLASWGREIMTREEYWHHASGVLVVVQHSSNTKYGTYDTMLTACTVMCTRCITKYRKV